MYNFICGLFMRGSCFNCEYKADAITSDIILGDCWCAKAEDIAKNNNRGISAVIFRTDRGKQFFEAVKSKFVLKTISVEEIVTKNGPLLRPVERNQNRDGFFEYLREHTFIESVKKYGYVNTKKMRIYAILYHLHIFGTVKKYLKK